MTRPQILPYGRQTLDQADIDAVIAVLRGDWLTTGPMVTQFEAALCQHGGSQFAVAIANGTAALHAMYAVAGLGPGDEIIVPAITFVATANAALYVGATPIFADVDPETLLIDPHSIQKQITPRTRAIIAVDYAGQPCDYKALRAIADQHGLLLLADACHSLGGHVQGQAVGSLADMTALSFHPVKHITTAEGGAILTDDPQKADALRRFRSHGLSRTAAERAEAGTWRYEMVELGYNYRLTDMACALGLSQIQKLPQFIERRRQLAAYYHKRLAEIPAIRPLQHKEAGHAWHLFVVRLPHRDRAWSSLIADNIGVNVHYLPVHLHHYYQTRFQTGLGLCPVAEQAYTEILSLPLFPSMTESDQDDVIESLQKFMRTYT